MSSVVLSAIKGRVNDAARRRLYRRFRQYTMLSEDKYVDTMHIASKAVGVAGSVIECGVWRGGAMAGIATILGDRSYYLFDSFQGLPPANVDRDGKKAVDYQQDVTSPTYYDNCSAPPEFAEEAMRLAGCSDFRLIKGWFDDTLPQFSLQSPIALLHLDGDWYDSTMTCLKAFFDHVAPDGIIAIDDYYAWDGCSRAVHDFLSLRSAPERIFSIGNVAYIRRRS